MLRLGGAIPPLPNMPSWRVQRQRHSFNELKYVFYELVIRFSEGGVALGVLSTNKDAIFMPN